MNNTAKILTALAMGAVAGIVTGILLAPAKGSDTRARMSEEADRLSELAKKNLKRVSELFECDASTAIKKQQGV